MQVIVMRHGTAEPFSYKVQTDSQRSLTAQGVEGVKASAQRIANNFNVVRVLASSYNRASETGQLVAQATGADYEHRSELTIANCNIRKLYAELEVLNAELSENACVVLVSHIPIVYELVEAISGRSCGFSFHTAEFVALDFASRRVLGDITDYK